MILLIVYMCAAKKNRFGQVWSVIRQNPFSGKHAKKQLLLLNIMQWAADFFILLLALSNLRRGNTVIFYINIACILINIPITIYTRVSRNEKPAIIIYIIALILLYTYAVYQGTNDGAGVLWIFAMPILNLFVFGIFPSIFSCGYFLMLFIALAVSPSLQSLLAYTYPEGHFLRFIFMYVSDLLISFFVAYENASSVQYQDDYADRLKEALKEERDSVNKISLQTIFAINRAVEAKDPVTGEHSKRVADISCRIAEKLGWNEAALKRMYDIALLHDIGKIGVNYDILTKTGELSDEEREAVNQHTIIGGAILKEVDFISGISDIIRHHHESWNGKGYPDGLKGKEIPVESRILAAADAYDAINHRQNLTPEQMKDKIRDTFTSGSGTLFDPAIAAIMLELSREDFHD